MQTPHHSVALEEQIGQWRSYLHRRQAIHSVDVAALEHHLRRRVHAVHHFVDGHGIDTHLRPHLSVREPPL